MNLVFAVFLAVVLLPFAADAKDAWPAGNAKKGRPLHDKECVACHAKTYGGDGSAMYTRPGRQVGDKNELVQRVAGCADRFNLGWFPEDEAHVAAYLNERYYKFK
ncbi:MAG: cytochrome c [Betaproteobacteria bacterium]|nr:cytochrome c [Betaproteobacteria bacterium]